MPSLEIGTRLIEYSVARGRSRRYTYFRFGPDLTLRITLPRVTTIDVNSVIRDKRDWILRAYEGMLQERRVLKEDSVMFDGKRLRIVFEESGEGEGERIIPEPEKGRVSIRAIDRSRIKELIRRWFLKETSGYVVRRLSELSGKVPARYSRADVREIKNWGYCTRDGRLSFSWQLIALPERLREYVLLHELTHLLEFNHSGAFKRRLRSVCPDYREREKELDAIQPYDRAPLTLP